MASLDEREPDSPTAVHSADSESSEATVTHVPSVRDVAADAQAETSVSAPATTHTNETDEQIARRLLQTSIGSGLLARQPTPSAEHTVAVAKVCPQCGGEYETGDRFCPKDGSPLRPKSGGDPLVGRVIAERYLVLARL